jgi:hypothetical protein
MKTAFPGAFMQLMSYDSRHNDPGTTATPAPTRHHRRQHERTLGPEHPITAEELACLGETYYLRKKYQEAEPLLRRALDILEKSLGPDHQTTRLISKNYSALLRQLNGPLHK